MPDLNAALLIRDIPDFPKPGILFKDITPILQDAAAFREVVERLSDAAKALEPDRIVGIESRGFLFGTPIALDLEVGFVPIRKAGKLPHTVHQQSYDLEYGTSTLEIHTDALQTGQRVVIVDDLLATGGTARAAATLVEKLGGVVVGFLFVVELAFLEGRSMLDGYTVRSLITY